MTLVSDRYDPDGEDRRLTWGDFHVSGWDWSSSDRIVFSHQDDPRINTNRRSGDLSVVNLGNGAINLLHAGNGIESSPRVSPDGQTVAFRSTGDQPEPIGLGDVYVMPVMGGERVKLAETKDRSPGILGWSGTARSSTWRRPSAPRGGSSGCRRTGRSRGTDSR